jgi:hypothetical protein
VNQPTLDLATIRSGGIRAAIQAIYDAENTTHEIQGKVRTVLAGGAIRSATTMFDQFLSGRPVATDAVVRQLAVDAAALETIAAALRALSDLVLASPGTVSLAPSTPAGLPRGEVRTW